MNFPVTNSRTVIVSTSKNHSDRNKLVKMLTDSELTNKLIKKNINIMENIVDDKNIFELVLYDYNMQPIEKMLDFTNNTLQQIIDIFDKLPQPKQNTNNNKKGGGEIDYRYKYMKYKLKYNEMRSVITKYN